MLGLRKTEKLVDGAFMEMAFKDLKAGDQFRLFDSGPGTNFEDGSKVYTAETDAVPYENEGNWMVKVADERVAAG